MQFQHTDRSLVDVLLLILMLKHWIMPRGVAYCTRIWWWFFCAQIGNKPSTPQLVDFLRRQLGAMLPHPGQMICMICGAMLPHPGQMICMICMIYSHLMI